MAFTIEEIEKAFSTFDEETGAYPRKMNGNINYLAITDYLRGRSNSLPQLQQEDPMSVYEWGGILLNLLKNIEAPSSNDKLVLNLLYHPALSPEVKYRFFDWVLKYAFENLTNSAFLAVLNELNKLGIKDDEIFARLVFNFGDEHQRNIKLDEHPFKNFLVNYIRLSKSSINLSYGYRSLGYKWNFLYFQLLDEERPDLAKEYALIGINANENYGINCLSKYRDGKYLHEIISLITNRENISLETAQSKFSAAIKLYEWDEVKYKNIVWQQSQQYLEYVQLNALSGRWEAGLYLKEFSGTTACYLPFRACAFHFLLKYKRENGIQIINNWVQSKVFIDAETLSILYTHLKQESFPFFESAIESPPTQSVIEFYRSVVQLLQAHFNPQQYLPLVWKLANSKSKPVRDFVAKTIAEADSEAETKAIDLLENKNAEIRQTAALILNYFTSSSAKDAIMKVLNKEQNDNARDILLQTIADGLPREADEKFVDEMIDAAQLRGKLNKTVEAWLNEDELPALFYKNGKQIPSTTLRFLLYRMSRVKTMRSDAEARFVIAQLDKERSSVFALALIKLYIDKGAKPEHKYLMALAALLGNDDVVDKIRTTINKWIDEGRYKMAEHGVGALAIQGSDKALRWVEWYSRKYKSKKANVGNAALEALENAAEELNITIQELGDRIVPDFGFEGLFKHFSANGDEYRAFIDSNFKIAFFNEDNKKLKSIPAAAEATLKDEFKNIAKEVRDIVKSQSSRLEYYLIIQRRWDYHQWQKFFLQNPVMFIYATKILWGIYENDQLTLTQTFICNEDTSLINAESEEIVIDENRSIGIVHPTQLHPAALQQWKQFFFDNSIETIFPQLERRLPNMKDINLSQSIITKFQDKEMAQGSIRSTLEKYGWNKGPTGDGGMIESFNLLYFEKKIEAVLEVEGVGAGFGWGNDERLGRLFIVDKTKAQHKWFYPENENDEKLIKLKDAPFIFLSEMLAAIEAIKPVQKG